MLQAIRGDGDVLGWAFLQRYLTDVDVYVFSRESYIPHVCDHGKSVIITPSIDVFSPKNQELPENVIRTRSLAIG